MAKSKMVLMYRRENGQDIWQYGPLRAKGIKHMRRQGWREIKWMEEAK